MKKTLLILAMSLGLAIATKAQTRPYVKVGVSSGLSRIVSENLEVGLQGGHNRVGATFQTFDSSRIHRQYFIGAKYTRAIPLFSGIDATASLGAKTNTKNIAAYVVEPGIGLDIKFLPNISFTTGVSAPISQTSVSARKLSFAGNAGFKFLL